MYLTIFTGPMFAGKTTRLIEYYNAIKVVNEFDKVAFKFSKDTRYEEDEIFKNDVLKRKMIYSHTKNNIPSIPIMTCDNIIDKLRLIKEHYNTIVNHIFIDEGQFFPNIKKWYHTILEIKNDKTHPDFNLVMGIKNIIISGLDYDASGNIFNQEFYDLFLEANDVLFAVSKCYKCNSDARFTILLDKKSMEDMEGNVLVGDNSIYQPACDKHINFIPQTN